MNARLEAAARALYEASVYGNDRCWRWDELDAETHQRFRHTVSYVLEAADVHDTTEWSALYDSNGKWRWPCTDEQSARTYGGIGWHAESRRVGPWVPVIERNDQ